MKNPQTRPPRFNVNDRVIVISPGTYRQMRGVVAELIEPSAGDHVYRYHVVFQKGTASTFFGFELELADVQSG